MVDEAGGQVGQDLRTDWRLGHFQDGEGRNRYYNAQNLPDRPATGSQIHDISCDTCGAELNVEIMSPDTRRARRVVKLLLGVLFALAGVILAVWAASQPNDPETFEYPAWQAPVVFSGVAVVLVGVCLMAFGTHETGIRIHPRAMRSRNAHWIVR